jgi:predicted RNA-binding Zn ribbon-like protein
MPRVEREPRPGPFTAADRVRRVDFRFDQDTRRDMLRRLRLASPLLDRPSARMDAAQEAALKGAGLEVPATISEWIIAALEEQTRLLLSARAADPQAVDGNPAAYRAAIRGLREAMRPFVAGWVDPETADIADWPAITAELQQREAVLTESRRPPPADRREVELAAALMASGSKWLALRDGVLLSDDAVLWLVHDALKAGGVEVLHPLERPDRLRALVFGPAAAAD